MSQKLERDLASGHRDLVARAKSALQAKNYDYTISLLQTVLKAEPSYFEGRKTLRRAEILKFQGMSSFARQMSSVKVSAMSMTLTSKKGWEEELVHAEEVLALDPFNHKANLIVAEAGTPLNLPEMKALGYETLAEGKPNDKAPLHDLAKVYMELKEFAKAVQTYGQILKIDPLDGEAKSGEKNASAAHASKKDGWETAGGYREILKDKNVAAQLEQDNRVIKSSEAIDAQIQRLFAQHEEMPTNVLFPKQIAHLYAQKEELDPAIQWYQYAFELGGKTDSSLEKIISDLQMRLIEKELQHLRATVEQEADPEAKAQAEAVLAEKMAERNQIALVQAEERVQKHPNDGEYRFELGQALYHVGQYQKALRELQQSLRQTSVRHQAMSLMGQAYLALRMNDLAVDTFSMAASEMLAMDETKKEIVYFLGLAYEAMGDTPKSLEQFKKIFALDMGYRDVAERVQKSYGS